MIYRRAWIACLPLLVLASAVCARDAADEQRRRDIRIVVVIHGQSSDPFWSVVANGVNDAARDLGVQVQYQAPGGFDMVEMSNLIDAAVASQPSGLVVSIPDADALGASIRAAVTAGLPVISINSGSDAFRQLGALTHLGQAEYDAGFGGGKRMAAAGVSHALCVNQEVGNVALDRRCQGFMDALASAGGSVEVLSVDLGDPDDTQQRIVGALTVNPGIDGVLTLGTTSAEPTLAALRETRRLGAITFGTFDLSPRVLEALRDGAMLFAIDQQQYLQGYLAVVLMTTFIETGTVPGGGEVIPTGPGFVTAATAAEVISLSARGLR